MGPFDKHFDFIVAVDLGEHVPDLDRCFLSMAAILAEGAFMVVTTANPLWALFLFLAESLKLKMPERLHKWRTRKELNRAAAAGGFIERSFVHSFLAPKLVVGFHCLNSARWPTPKIWAHPAGGL